MEYFIDALRKYAEFTGRAQRKQYWMFVLVYFLIMIVLSLVDTMLNTIWVSAIASIALLIPSISITTRRLHDIGRTGWWQLIYFVPLIGFIVMLVFLCQDSQGNNEYGVSPKYPEA